MKLILLFSLLLIYNADVPYACLDKTNIEDERICGRDWGITFFIRPCPKGEICKIQENALSYCEKKPIVKYEGDSCTIDEECISRYCRNNKCAFKLDKSCFFDKDCPTGYYCPHFSCVSYSVKSEDCSYKNDNRCAFGYECEYINGRSECSELYSLKAGEKTFHKDFCESGFEKDGVCYDTKPVGGTEFISCTVSTTCQYKILDGDGDVVGTITGDCITNVAKESYCRASSQSKEWKEFVKAVAHVRETANNNKIHQSTLIEDFNSKKFEYNSLLREKWLKLEQHGVDDCVLDGLFVSLGSGFINMSYMLMVVVFVIFV